VAKILPVIAVCTITCLLVVQRVVPTPQIVFELEARNQQKPLSPAFVVNASCDTIKPTVKASKLSQTLFPVSNPEQTDSWVGENHKMLQALFRCMELSNCGPNQKKGAHRIFNLLDVEFMLTRLSCHIGLGLFPGSVLGMGWWGKYMVSDFSRSC